MGQVGYGSTVLGQTGGNTYRIDKSKMSSSQIRAIQNQYNEQKNLNSARVQEEQVRIQEQKKEEKSRAYDREERTQQKQAEQEIALTSADPGSSISKASHQSITGASSSTFDAKVRENQVKYQKKPPVNPQAPTQSLELDDYVDIEEKRLKEKYGSDQPINRDNIRNQLLKEQAEPETFEGFDGRRPSEIMREGKYGRNEALQKPGQVSEILERGDGVRLLPPGGGGAIRELHAVNLVDYGGAMEGKYRADTEKERKALFQFGGSKIQDRIAKAGGRPDYPKFDVSFDITYGGKTHNFKTKAEADAFVDSVQEPEMYSVTVPVTAFGGELPSEGKLNRLSGEITREFTSKRDADLWVKHIEARQWEANEKIVKINDQIRKENRDRTSEQFFKVGITGLAGLTVENPTQRDIQVMSSSDWTMRGGSPVPKNYVGQKEINLDGLPSNIQVSTSESPTAYGTLTTMDKVQYHGSQVLHYGSRYGIPITGLVNLVHDTTGVYIPGQSVADQVTITGKPTISPNLTPKGTTAEYYNISEREYQSLGTGDRLILDYGKSLHADLTGYSQGIRIHEKNLQEGREGLTTLKASTKANREAENEILTEIASYDDGFNPSVGIARLEALKSKQITDNMMDYIPEAEADLQRYERDVAKFRQIPQQLHKAKTQELIIEGLLDGVLMGVGMAPAIAGTLPGSVGSRIILGEIIDVGTSGGAVILGNTARNLMQGTNRVQASGWMPSDLVGLGVTFGTAYAGMSLTRKALGTDTVTLIENIEGKGTVLKNSKEVGVDMTGDYYGVQDSIFGARHQRGKVNVRNALVDDEIYSNFDLTGSERSPFKKGINKILKKSTDLKTKSKGGSQYGVEAYNSYVDDLVGDFSGHGMDYRTYKIPKGRAVTVSNLPPRKLKISTFEVGTLEQGNIKAIRETTDDNINSVFWGKSEGARSKTIFGGEIDYQIIDDDYIPYKQQNLFFGDNMEPGQVQRYGNKALPWSTPTYENGYIVEHIPTKKTGASSLNDIFKTDETVKASKGAKSTSSTRQMLESLTDTKKVSRSMQVQDLIKKAESINLDSMFKGGADAFGFASLISGVSGIKNKIKPRTAQGMDMFTLPKASQRSEQISLTRQKIDTAQQMRTELISRSQLEKAQVNRVEVVNLNYIEPVVTTRTSLKTDIIQRTLINPKIETFISPKPIKPNPTPIDPIIGVPGMPWLFPWGGGGGNSWNRREGGYSERRNNIVTDRQALRRIIG